MQGVHLLRMMKQLLPSFAKPFFEATHVETNWRANEKKHHLLILD